MKQVVLSAFGALTLAALTLPQDARAIVLSLATADYIGNSYVQMIVFTYNTSPADWITVSSIGVKAAYYPAGSSAIFDTWFDTPIPQGELVTIWERWRGFTQPGLYAISGQHRYTEAGVPKTAPGTFKTVWVGYY